MSTNNQSASSSIKEKDVMAMMKFIVSMSPHEMLVGVPSWFPAYNGLSECDAIIGPCACGAIHNTGDKRTIRLDCEIERSYERWK